MSSQRRSILRGFVPSCEIFKMINWAGSAAGLVPELVAALERAVGAYEAATGPAPVTVTSGHRTLWRQAELMASLTPAQLDALYGRHGEPEYLPPLKALWAAGVPPHPTAVYAILAKRRAGYISSHLYGAAVDLAVEGLVDAARLSRLLEAEGFTVLDERDAGLPCLHATFRA